MEPGRLCLEVSFLYRNEFRFRKSFILCIFIYEGIQASLYHYYEAHDLCNQPYVITFKKLIIGNSLYFLSRPTIHFQRRSLFPKILFLFRRFLVFGFLPFPPPTASLSSPPLSMEWNPEIKNLWFVLKVFPPSCSHLVMALLGSGKVEHALVKPPLVNPLREGARLHVCLWDGQQRRDKLLVEKGQDLGES